MSPTFTRMPIPDFQAVMLPLLRDLAQGERQTKETVDALAGQFQLTDDERATRISSGHHTVFGNRIAWAKAHLKAAGLVQSPRRGVYELTERGRLVLAENPPAITMSLLGRFPEYVAFRYGSKDEATPPAGKKQSDSIGISVDPRTPDDLINDGYQQLRSALATELRESIAAMSPRAFEHLVVDLLSAMDYGGPQENAAIVVGKGGDEGIDGIIKEDRLGLETIYIQAKRWQGTVGRPEIQRFSGALQGQRARKGVFITSSSFSAEARAFVNTIQATIVLVDGAQLAELMIDHDVGVATSKSIAIKRLDSDYFSAE